MFRHLFWSVSPFFNADGGDGGGGSGGGGDDKPKVLTQADVDAAAAAARRAAEKDVDQRVKDAVAAALAQAKTDAEAEDERKRNEAAGDFDKIRKDLEKQRDDAIARAEKAEGEATAKTERITKADTLLKERLDDRVKALEKVPDLKTAYEAKYPADAEADLLDRLDWFEDPRTKVALDTANGAADQHRTNLRNAAGVIPHQNGNATQADQQARADMKRTVTREF